MFPNSLNKTPSVETEKIKGYFLDDEREPEHVRWKSYPNNVEWEIFRNGDDFLEALYNNEQPDLISLDYELHRIPMVNGWNGVTVLEKILEYYKQQGWSIRYTMWIIHSRAKGSDKEMQRMISVARREQMKDEQNNE
ncbi:hypothetical protein PBI_SCTP2_407 [Salicola phage SCTP-2]|nr:hypothetical protein PBI_SCTP2_407 [Salicola phage SCTP-2]